MPAAIAPRVVAGSSTDQAGLVARVAERLRCPVEVVGPELKRSLGSAEAGAVAVVVLDASPVEVAALLDAASAASVPFVVVGSSAAVYGAWADNAVPLTEDVPLRPNPGFRFAASAAETERVVAEWRDGHPSSRVAVLRFAPVLVPGEVGGLADALTRPSLLRPADSLPPVQALHVEDAASAVAHVVTARLDGTFNVSPDGHVSGETARALSAAGVPVALPDRLAAVAERVAYRLGLGGIEGAAAAYRLHPWAVANDRLRATGWVPAYSTEEALVACRKGSWWRELSPKRRQEVALGATAGLLLTLVGGAFVALRRARRRHV